MNSAEDMVGDKGGDIISVGGCCNYQYSVAGNGQK